MLSRQFFLFVPDFVKEAEEQIAKGLKLPAQEEVTIKFGKGLAEPFQSKDGREFMRITIPNQDPADKTPWASFVLPAKAVHENQYGKGLWAKIPARCSYPYRPDPEEWALS